MQSGICDRTYDRFVKVCANKGDRVARVAGYEGHRGPHHASAKDDDLSHLASAPIYFQINKERNLRVLAGTRRLSSSFRRRMVYGRQFSAIRELRRATTSRLIAIR
jgi:hypothetical protein